MAKFKIIWSLNAKNDLFDILKYYYHRNGNAIYSRKLNKKIKKTISLLSRNPLIGISTDVEFVRTIGQGDFQIIYEISDLIVEIHMIWDTRRNSDDKQKRIDERIK